MRAVITEDCCSGCMKIVDKNIFITSLKCSWIKKNTKSYKLWMDIRFTIEGQ